MFKKIILASVLALAFSGTANAKQIMRCSSDFFAYTDDEISCGKDNKSFNISLKKLYHQGWRLIDVESNMYNGKITSVYYYLEK